MARFKYNPCDHVVTGDPEFITNTRLRDLITKGPKFREKKSFTWKDNFNNITDSVEDYARKWAKEQLPVTGDIESLRYPSWCLCRLLDILVETEENVVFNRKCTAIHNHVLVPPKILYSGSRGEGFTFHSSDVDLMFVEQNIVVLESKQETLSTDDSKTVLLMRRESCNPGFVILQSLNRAKNYAIKKSIVEYHGHSVVSSLLFRDEHRVSSIGQVGHGPCNTHRYVFETDIAYCFECKTWPTEANEFIYRQRPYGWPQKALLDKIVCRGCHLVPIGDKNPDLTHIQWRLSFSVAEKDLVHSFNHTQFLVYGFLKIFLKQFVNKFQSLDGVLCSYFLKTAMFYCIESTPLSLWRDDMLIPCFWVCLHKLITWVEQGYCPNYFVPQNNMFRNKVVGEHQRKLLDVLNQCRRVGWRCLILCKHLRSLQKFISYPELLSNSKLILSDRDRECSLDVFVVQLSVDFRFPDQEKADKAIVRSLSLLSHCRTQQEVDISTFFLYNVFRCTGRSNFHIHLNTNNKGEYKSLRKCQCLLLTSLKNMGYIGMLDMATFYHHTGQYQKAILILERIITTWKPYLLYSSVDHRQVPYTDLYKRYVCGQGKSLHEKMRFAFARDISMSEAYFCPTELSYDIYATFPFPIHIPFIPYAVFLLFLCYHRLGDIDKSLSVLSGLEVLVRDCVRESSTFSVVLNMLAICLDKVGNRQGAVEMCLLSQKLKPDKNGAAKLLDQILTRWS